LACRGFDGVTFETAVLTGDYNEIRTTVSANNPRHSPETRDAFVAQMAEYAKLGVKTAITMPPTGAAAAWVDGMAPAFRQLAELG
jgi:hypothetical protein